MAEWKGPVPFDPKKHKPVDAGSGKKMTEFLATEIAEDGQVFNHPTVWFAQNGQVVDLSSPDDRGTATQLAKQYEAATGKRFPRFGKAFDADGNKIKENFKKGSTTAQRRSNAGGATRRSLIGSGDR
mgnify:FL=1